ncbi:winged helix-turn-helix transcriptional regulator [Mailhella sp.]|uniref:winged helix-turn-helix transcriptional regulator n=1 Tax=Mailhella sp. TaxID=1981029 RepID=UPI003AB377CD
MNAQPSCCCSNASHPAEGEIHCPVEATLDMIGGKYKTLILWKLISGAMRFSELRRAVPAATPKMLTQQLRELERDGLVHREIFPVVPPRVEYSLTEFGMSIRPVLESMYAWGSRCLERKGLSVNCSMEPLP